MANIVFGYPNQTDSATLSGGSWLSSLPLDNLKDSRTRKLARSSDATTASTQFDLDLGAASGIGLIALRRHTMSIAAQIRITASDDAGFSNLLYDSGFNDVYESVIDSLELFWEDNNFWLGQPSEDERSRFATLYSSILPTIIFARYWRVEINDTSNADGYVDIGSLFISDSYTAEKNYIYGASIQNESFTSVDTSQSGVEFFDRRDQKRVARFTLDNMSINNGYQRAFDLTQIVGIESDVFISLDPEDEQNRIRNSFVGRLTSTNPLSFPRYNQTSMTFDIRETV